MQKNQIKELLFIILFSIINILIAYFFTTSLGIQNIILFRSLTATEYVITYEVIIFFILSFIEAVLYEFLTSKIYNKIIKG